MSVELHIHNKIVSAIESRIVPIFKPGAFVTVIVRTPGNDDADVMVTADTNAGIRAAIERLEKRPPIGSTS